MDDMRKMGRLETNDTGGEEMERNNSARQNS